MKTPTLLLTTLVLFIAGSFVLRALHPATHFTTEKTTPMEDFLGLDCAYGKLAEEAVNAILKQPEVAEAYFTEIIKEGLPKEAVAAAHEDYDRLFTQRERYRERSPKITLVTAKGTTEVWNLPKDSRAEFIAGKAENFQRMATVRAMEGLRVLKTDSALGFLADLAEDERFQLQELARELLEE